MWIYVLIRSHNVFDEGWYSGPEKPRVTICRVTSAGYFNYLRFVFPTC